MSYSCYISFKQIDANDVYSFLSEVKKKAREKCVDITLDNYYFSPVFQKYPVTNVPSTAEWNLMVDKTKEWFKHLFTYRFFYKDGLLMVFGIPDALYDLFDDTIYFQNSCDHDYELSAWDKIAKFKQIADKWRSCSHDELCKLYEVEYGYFNEDDPDSHLEYFRRSRCYDEIWEGDLEGALYNDDSIVYLSLFQFYDTVDYSCALKIMKKHEEEIAEYEKEEKEKTEKICENSQNDLDNLTNL